VSHSDRGSGYDTQGWPAIGTHHADDRWPRQRQESLFGLEFLYRAALDGEPGIFISFEERANDLRTNTSTLGWDLVPLEQNGKLLLFEARIDPKAIVTGEFGIQSFLAILDHKIKAMGAKRVTIDVLMRLINDERREQNEPLTLHQWLSEHKVTALLSVKAPRDADHARHYEFLDYMADCVIHLDNRMLGQLSTRRLRLHPTLLETLAPDGIMLQCLV
jgi:circadian clock protein KaiC